MLGKYLPTPTHLTVLSAFAIYLVLVIAQSVSCENIWTFALLVKEHCSVFWSQAFSLNTGRKSTCETEYPVL